MVENGNHYVHIQQAQKFNKIVEEFLLQWPGYVRSQHRTKNGFDKISTNSHNTAPEISPGSIVRWTTSHSDCSGYTQRSIAYFSPP